MVVHLLKVHFASALESDGASLEEVDVEYWTNARREQAVKAQSVVEQASFVEDAGCVTLLE